MKDWIEQNRIITPRDRYKFRIVETKRDSIIVFYIQYSTYDEREWVYVDSKPFFSYEKAIEAMEKFIELLPEEVKIHKIENPYKKEDIRDYKNTRKRS